MSREIDCRSPRQTAQVFGRRCRCLFHRAGESRRRLGGVKCRVESSGLSSWRALLSRTCVVVIFSTCPGSGLETWH